MGAPDHWHVPGTESGLSALSAALPDDIIGQRMEPAARYPRKGGTMAATANQLYSVGGVLLERPFKVRRLGHVGFNFDDVAGALRFYRTLLGFRISDVIDFRTRIDPAKLEGLDPNTYFTRFATD